MYSWKELESQFKALTSDLQFARLDLQWGDAGKHWRIAGAANPEAARRFESLARIGGMKLAAPHVSRDKLPPEVVDEADPAQKWVIALKSTGSSFRPGPIGQQRDKSGKELGYVFTGTIDNPAEASANMCLDVGTRFPENIPVPASDGSLRSAEATGAFPQGGTDHLTSIVFYSWQSDLPNATNRGFIQRCLEDATSRLSGDAAIDVEPVVDRDTAGVPGSPDIASTIFQKIDKCHVFACDVSIVIRAEGQRPTPNPNVLIELGYAVKVLGWNRIVMVMNLAYGQPSELPFDLRMKRVMTYQSKPTNESRAEDRKSLTAMLVDALRLIYGFPPGGKLAEPTG